MEANKLTVGVFVPCCIDQFSTRTAKNMVKLLQDAGFSCAYPEEQTCCGQGLYLAGDREGAKLLGSQIIDQFRPYRYVVTCSSGCVAYVRRCFNELFFNSAYHNDHRLFADKTLDVSDFLCRWMDGRIDCDSNRVKATIQNISFPHRVAFLEHHRTSHDYGMREEPRQLLRMVQGLSLMELGDCDMDGGFIVTNPDVAAQMARQIIDKAHEMGAEYITSTEPMLITALQKFVEKEKTDMKCVNLVDILEG